MTVHVGNLVRKADDRKYWKKRGIRSFIVDGSNRLGLVIKVESWGCTVQWSDGEKLVYQAEQLEVMS